MANAYTKLSDIINPEVMGNLINAKVEAQCKLTPYAKVDTTLVGVPGDTKTVPSWTYVGDAADFNPEKGADMETAKLTATSQTFTVKAAGKSIGIYQTAINSGLGDPVGQANIQLAKAIAQKVDNDLMDAVYGATTTVTANAQISYAGLVDAITKFEDEENGVEKVLFIHPAQEAKLLKDSDFVSVDKIAGDMMVSGAIGKIAGAWVKKSLKVKKNEGATHYVNPIIKIEPDSADTEYTEDELPALTVFLKKDIQVDAEWFPKAQRHDITAVKYYGVALTNDSKVVLAEFKV